MGWERDCPDYRDFTIETLDVKQLLDQAKILSVSKYGVPSGLDLRSWCSPLENQELSGICATKAAVGFADYFQQRAFGRKPLWRQFLSVDTRTLLFYPGDQSPYLRSALIAIREFGLAVHYLRLNPPGSAPNQVFYRVKLLLAAGLPSVFGFSVFRSTPRIGDRTDDIPFPRPWDYLEGGLAVAAVGYFDQKEIDN